AEIVMQNVFISPSTISQYAAMGSFDYGHLEKNRQVFKERRDFLFSQLKTLFEIDAVPEGAFYIWADVSRYSDNSYAFAKEILEKTHVAITPGVDFGQNRTDRYVRFAYTRDVEHLKEGVERLKNYLLNR
ncbi:MAG: aminotransferase class I/II-fold pyridoxal phosphate-dependent enzyme, partial [Aquificae bacterium]|nr:aminotransferase class I/II-fold pyridoxal phosphate-dependent enzyme [Aquificota bacterium]